MNILKRKQKGTINSQVKVDNIFVITSIIISSYNDGSGCGTMCVTMYFLAKYKNGEYFELFSGKKLETKDDTTPGFLFQTFDTPYIEKAEPLSKYLKNPNQSTIDIQSLFDFITNMNVLNSIGAFLDENNDTTLNQNS